MSVFSLPDKKLVETVHEWFRDDKRELSSMRKQMRQDYDFYAGDQWDPQDAAFLRENQRPIVTFNRTAPTIDSVTGSERANRQEVRYLPRTLDDAEIAEMFTEVSRWVRDRSDAEDEESEAFEDCVKVGIGCTETWVDFETELDGEIRLSRIPPLETLWDHAAIQRNLADARRVYRVKMLPKSEIRELWPDKKIRFGSRDWALEAREKPHIADPEIAYEQGELEKKGTGEEIPVVQVQWWERRPVFRVANPLTGQVETLTASERDSVVSQVGELPSVRQTRKEFYQAFIVGDTVLDKRPLHESENDIIPGFSLKFITGKRDESEGTWFGLMKAMRDPQKWSNKFFSQIQDIVASNAKGGLLAEQDAFVNPRKAEEDWAKPDRIIWTNPGALQNKKIQERTPADFPTAVANLMQIAMGAVRDTSGVNIEQLGLAERTQPGVVEQSRIRQALITLTIFFDSLRRYRKEQGRLLLYMINRYVNADTMIRVVGEERFIQFTPKDQVPRFDIIVDQAPTSPNQKEEIWQGLQMVLPPMFRAGIPIPPEVMDYIPLPASAVAKFKKFFAEQTQAQSEAQQRQAQVEEEKARAEIAGERAQAIKDIASGVAQLEARKTDRDKAQIDALKVILEGLSKLEGQDAGTGNQAGNR